MDYRWDVMVAITVPKGLNGWQDRGLVIINGKSYTFPVGIETEVPQPVAHYIDMIAKKEEQEDSFSPPGLSFIDPTLSVTGMAADAKATGDEIEAISKEVELLKSGNSDVTVEGSETLEFESYVVKTDGWPTEGYAATASESAWHKKRKSTLSDGRMYVEWDENKVNGFNVLFYMHDSEGVLRKILSAYNGTTYNPAYTNGLSGDLDENVWLESTGEKSDFITASGAFSVPVPKGYSVTPIFYMDGAKIVFPDGTMNRTSAKSWATTEIHVTLKTNEVVNTSAIVRRNSDVLPLVKAAARYGYNANGGYNTAKQMTMLAMTDLHIDKARYLSALTYMDAISQVDFGICLGDMMGSYFSDNDGTWFTNGINDAVKKVYPLIGNHDAGNTNSTATSATKQQQFNKFFAPVLSKLGMTGLTKTYYSVNADYGVTLIAPDCHDVPDTMSNGTTFAVNRKEIGYSQAQVDWLISTLAAVPADNHVIVAVHNTLDPATMVEGVWTQDGHMNSDHNDDTGDYPDMIPEIIDAWQRGASMSKTYAPVKNTAQPTLTVNADFSIRGAGVFAGYLRGHTHADYIAKMTNFPNQNIFCMSATAHDGWQNYKSDLPRVTGEKTEDCITVVVVDKVSRKVKLVRIGSNITFDMVRRDMIAIPY